VGNHPVRLSISDDLQRGHGSVFFRAWFALPYLIWRAIWALAALPLAVLNWVLTLARGRSPERLHAFLARFVRYATHTYAYLNLAAEPLPRFDGKPGYPIDLEIEPPRRQPRWSVALRLILALPAGLLASALVGSGVSVYGALPARTSVGGMGLLGAAALLGWFYALARGRMTRGLRDAAAFALSYGAQLWAYLLLLTDEYPASDPAAAIGPLPVREDPIRLEVQDDLRRSRLTVFFRLLLGLPHYVWLALWGLLACLAAIASWFATLLAGRSPAALHRFLSAYVRYLTHVGAFVYLIANPFPGFVGEAGRYPVQATIEPARRQRRATVGLRLILALPALILASAYGSLMLVAAVLGWFAALATGKQPRGMRNSGALGLRYGVQTAGYLLLLTDGYPYSGPCAGPASGGGQPPTIPVPAGPLS